MSRNRPSNSYDHRIRRIGSWGDFEISWCVDRYVSGSRMRFPTAYRRLTDEDGAVRFAFKWGVDMPPEQHP